MVSVRSAGQFQGQPTLWALVAGSRPGMPWNESAYSNKQFDERLIKAEGHA
jgi:hypothetical protein